MEILSKIILVSEILLMAYLALASLYFFVFAVASRFYKERKETQAEKSNSVAILIPSYREDGVIVETARSAMEHSSNSSVFDVMIIADSLRPDTIAQIDKTGAYVLPVEFDESTKSKSINKGLEAISGKCEYVIILDADNIMHTGFIDRMLDRLKHGYSIVQGHRTAKNINTNFSILDGLSEEVNNAIFRKGHQVLGFSSSIIGSGFACEYKLLKDLMGKAEAVGGFDKELELLLLERKIKIGYAQEALVYDEKIQQPDAFVNQRRRWLSAQLIYLKKNISNGFIQLLKHRNFDYFDKLIQFALPPRIISLGLTFSFVMIHSILMLIRYHEIPDALFFSWIGVFLVSSLAVFLAIPAEKYSAGMMKALLSLPRGFLLTLLALIKIKGANKKFIHTVHGTMEEQQLTGNEHKIIINR